MLAACNKIRGKRLQTQRVRGGLTSDHDINSYHLYQRLSPVLDTMDTKTALTVTNFNFNSCAIKYELQPSRDASQEVGMSGVKRMMELREEQWNVATDIAVDASVLERCEFHGEIYDPLGDDNTPAYKLGNYRLSAGKLGNLFSSPREMTDTIKAVIEDAAMECDTCAKWRAE
jgi:hypothetical protein